MVSITFTVLLPFVLAPDSVAETTGQHQPGSDVKIIFLTQDAAPDAWDHSGCCGYVLEPLRDLVKELYPNNFVFNDVGKLIRNDVPPYYIYNKRYCRPIGELLGANVFVMTQVWRRTLGPVPPEKWRFDVRAKVYSALYDTEAVFYSVKDVTFPEAVEQVDKQKTVILKKLLELMRPTDG